MFHRAWSWFVREWPLAAAYAIVGSVLSVNLGQDVNFDLLNYHFFNPYQWLNGRLDRDVLPADLQTFFNPLVDVPFYLAVDVWRVRPIAIGGALGAIHGLNLWLVHRVTVLLLPATDARVAFFAGLVAVVGAATGAAFYPGLASTMNDNTVSVVVLMALAVLLHGISGPAELGLRSVALAGFGAGLVAGAKLTAAMYTVGLAAASATIGGTAVQRATRVFVFGSAAVLGISLTGGFWFWTMWSHFENPLFPFYNGVFRSPWGPIEDFFDDRFLPRNTLQAWLYPLYFLRRQRLTIELEFRDGRFAAAFIAIAAIVLWRLWRGRSVAASHAMVRARLIALSVWWSVAYVTWLRMSSIYRYAVTLEMTALVLIIGGAAYVLRSSAKGLSVAVPVCAVLVATTVYPDWGRVVWGDDYFGVDRSRLAPYADSTILVQNQPNSYLLPFFPESVTFLRLDSEWTADPAGAMSRRLVERLSAARPDRVFSLDTPALGNAESRARRLAAVGFTVDETRCATIPNVSEPGRICHAVPLGR